MTTKTKKPKARKSEKPKLKLDKADFQILRRNRTREIRLVTGASGAGKTLLMTGLIADILMRFHIINTAYKALIGTPLLPLPLNVWSNYDVAFRYQPSRDGFNWKPADLHTLPLDVEKLYTFAPEMREGHVFIDELDLIADRQDWQSGGSKLLVAILRQVRKRHMGMTGSIQSMNWLNPRFLFQIDAVVGCRDASVTAFGKDNGIEPGEMTFLSARDRSGGITGYQYDETGQEFDSWFRGRAMFNLYNTDQEFNPFDHMISYSIKRKKRQIDPFAAEPRDIDADFDAVADVLREAVNKDIKRMPLKDLQEELKNKGVTIPKQELLEHLEEVHGVGNYLASGYPKINLDGVTNI